MSGTRMPSWRRGALGAAAALVVIALGGCSGSASWDGKPAWLSDAVPGVGNLWAPELVEHDGTWYLYYSASTFGTNTSVIAVATNTTLDPNDPDYAWVDGGR
jgi:GH43 family beta-xylosidase